MNGPSFRGVEQLSAYLDGQLSKAEVARLEARLESDLDLRALLEDLRRTRAVLRRLPSRRAPRNFSLTPEMVGGRPPLPRAYPVMRLATVLATLLLFFSFATNAVIPLLSGPRFAAAPAPMGMGGGGGDSGLETNRPQSGGGGAEEATPMPEAAFAAPTEAPMPTEAARAAAPPAEQPKVAVEQPPEEARPAPLISMAWQVALAAAALVSGVSAFLLRRTAIRKWREKRK